MQLLKSTNITKISRDHVATTCIYRMFGFTCRVSLEWNVKWQIQDYWHKHNTKLPFQAFWKLDYLSTTLNDKMQNHQVNVRTSFVLAVMAMHIKQEKKTTTKNPQKQTFSLLQYALAHVVSPLVHRKRLTSAMPVHWPFTTVYTSSADMKLIWPEL